MALLDINQVFQNLIAVAIIGGFGWVIYLKLIKGSDFKLDLGRFVGRKK